jgi:nitrile hydratase
MGARIVARAWTDPAYKKRLLADGTAAIKEFGHDMGALHLVVVENTPQVHNVIVCTLCSCYPRAVLGLPPSWYKSREYRARAVREPRAVLKEFGTSIPDQVEMRVHDSTADMRYLVLPMRPEGTEALTEAELAALVTRDCMIGVTLPLPA